MKLEYTCAETADISVIFGQAKELIDSYENLGSIDYDGVLTWVNRKISSRLSEYCCVLLDGQKAAYYRLCADGELDDLYVLPDFRGRGIGSEILQKCIGESEKPLYLYVFSRNTRAVSFYERLGFSCRETVGKTRMILERKG